jgi:hypothetical protein
MIGAKTIGNATLIAFDDVPIIATDPWLGGETGAYFGSWQLSHQIPQQEMEDILACQYVWFSHGHPDHMNAESIKSFRDTCILLPDHVGGRIFNDLQTQGYTVRILPNREWVELSKNVRVCCASDVNQDALLLVDVNGHLFVNLNDGGAIGSQGWVRSVVKQYKQSYLLKLSGYGDADMINFFDEDGNRIPPRASRKPSVGHKLSKHVSTYGVTHVIPFSSFHKYQRSDSLWVNDYTTPLEAFSQGFDRKKATLLPPFVKIDCNNGEISEINPLENENIVLPPEKFGDNWGDLLDPSDMVNAEQYFQQKESLKDYFGFINLRVGGKDNFMVLNKALKTGITFQAPRNSLMTAIQYEVFDDLLIGNFMKTTLHGLDELYPHFTPVVAKYADNGRAQTKEELIAYMAEYRKRSPLPFFLNNLQKRSEWFVRQFFPRHSLVFKTTRKFTTLVQRYLV